MTTPPRAPHEMTRRPAVAAAAPRGTMVMPPCAPHEYMNMMRPAPAAAAPHETMMMAPFALHETMPLTEEEEEEEEEELRLSDFDKIGDLGEGGWGVVTKVRLRGSSKVFALKTAYYPYPDAEEEAEVLGRATAGSAHLVRCHAVFRRGGDEPALLLEFMDAGSLDRVLYCRRGRGLPQPALAEVAARCLAGLSHLHSRGVAHLDLKPDNLLSNSAGDVKIGDFSSSGIFSGSAGERLQVSVVVGTTAYMSPERFAPNARAGPRGACAADVWGLGVTVLELFLGHCPILPTGETPSLEKLKQAICYGEPPSVPESAAASVELRGFVAACLQKDPRRRATVGQLLAHPFVARRDVEGSNHALREIIVETMQG